MLRVRLIAFLVILTIGVAASAAAQTLGPVSSCIRGESGTCSFDSTGASVTVWGMSTRGDVTSITVEAVRYDGASRVVLARCSAGGENLPDTGVVVPNPILVPASPVAVPTSPTPPPSPIPAPPGGQIDPVSIDAPAASGTLPAANCSAQGSSFDVQGAAIQCEARGSGRLIFGCYSAATPSVG